MSIENGIYNIRFVPKDVQFPFLGGVYATGQLVNAPIRAVALNPAASGEQKWKVQAVEGKPGSYFILNPGINAANAPDVPGFGVGKPGSHSEPVMLTLEGVSELFLVQVDAEHGLYSIQARTGLVGASWAVTEEDGLLWLKPYPFYDNSPPLPRWQFVPTDY